MREECLRLRFKAMHFKGINLLRNYCSSQKFKQKANLYCFLTYLIRSQWLQRDAIKVFGNSTKRIQDGNDLKASSACL